MKAQKLLGAGAVSFIVLAISSIIIGSDSFSGFMASANVYVAAGIILGALNKES